MTFLQQCPSSLTMNRCGMSRVCKPSGLPPFGLTTGNMMSCSFAHAIAFALIAIARKVNEFDVRISFQRFRIGLGDPRHFCAAWPFAPKTFLYNSSTNSGEKGPRERNRKPQSLPLVSHIKCSGRLTLIRARVSYPARSQHTIYNPCIPVAFLEKPRRGLF